MACHTATVAGTTNSEASDSITLPPGRLMIEKWLSTLVDFPVEKVHLGGTKGSGPNHFLDFVSNHLDATGKDEQEDLKLPQEWLRRGLNHSDASKLHSLIDRCLTEAFVFTENNDSESMKQKSVIFALANWGCKHLPPHDQMFAIPDGNLRYQTEHCISNSGTRYPLSCYDGLTVIDMLTPDYGEEFPRWGIQSELTRDGPLFNLRYCVEDDADDDHVYLPWSGCNPDDESSRKHLERIQGHIAEMFFKPEMDTLGECEDDLKGTIMGAMAWDTQFPQHLEHLKTCGDIDEAEEDFVDYLRVKEDEFFAIVGQGTETDEVKEKVREISGRLREDLCKWKEYFSTKATWQSFGLVNRNNLALDPILFNEWIDSTLAKGNFNMWQDFSLSHSAIDLLQFASEDIGFGVSWRLEGVHGEVAVVLLGSHGSLWVLKERNDLKQIIDDIMDEDDSDEDSSFSPDSDMDL